MQNGHLEGAGVSAGRGCEDRLCFPVCFAVFMGIHRSVTSQSQALRQQTFLQDLAERQTVAGRTARLISSHS